jgi:hypothetical protein
MMQMPSFQRCVGAIADTIARQEAPSASSAGASAIVASFLLVAHSKMPDYLRFGFFFLVLALECWSYPLRGKPFHQLDLADRTRQLGRWQKSRLGFKRSLVAFCQTLVTFGLFSELYRRDLKGQECRVGRKKCLTE